MHAFVVNMRSILSRHIDEYQLVNQELVKENLIFIVSKQRGANEDLFYGMVSPAFKAEPSVYQFSVA